MPRHPSAIGREQRAMRSATAQRRRHRDDREAEDARYTDAYIEPYQARRERCVVMAETSMGRRQVATYATYAPAIEHAKRALAHCTVRDTRTWRVVFDNQKG
jgi:hypothetical protein